MKLKKHSPIAENLFTGVMWPLEGMPVALQWLAKCMPFTLPIISLRCVVKRAWTVPDFEVWSGMAASTIWILFFILFSLYCIRVRV